MEIIRSLKIKHILKVLAIFLFLINLNGFALSQIQMSIPFIWSNDSLNGDYFEKTAMHVPVKFVNDTLTYYFQFDTGSEQSFIYNGFENLGIEDSVLTDIGVLKLNELQNSYVYKVNGLFNIGTIGADFLKNKIVEIDYLKQNINILSTYDFVNYNLIDLRLNNGRPIISLSTTDNISFDFIFDTGSSLFELWTTKKLWKKYRDKSQLI